MCLYCILFHYVCVKRADLFVRVGGRKKNATELKLVLAIVHSIHNRLSKGEGSVYHDTVLCNIT